MLINEIRGMLEEYFDALYTQDFAVFDNVFHPQCTLYSGQDDNLVVRPFAEYRAIVAGRKSPKETGSPRQDEILTIDVMSNEAALVKVRLRLFDNIMEDYLNIIKVKGKWMILAKVFHRVGAAPAQK